MLRYFVGNENIRGLEIPGLGVGLRGVRTEDEGGVEMPALGSRRGSEASYSSDSIRHEMMGLGLKNVREEEIV
jgi:hypothetical protein